MSISCDKCKEQGTEENPVYYVESVLRGVPMLESLRDIAKLVNSAQQPCLVTPFTLHLHGQCAIELQEYITLGITNFIDPPQEKRSGKKETKKQKKS